MKADATMRIIPPQNLISTIYRQSWHPVASTKPNLNKKTSRTATSSLSGSLQNAESPFHQTQNQSRRKERITSASSYRKIAPPSTRSYPRIQTTNETSYQHENEFEPAEQRAKYEIGHDLPSYSNITVADLRNSTINLSTWRRKLNTCVNTKNRELSNQNDVTLPQSSNHCNYDADTDNVIHHVTNTESQSKKNYKVCTYSNSTLAKICLQGKSPPVKERPVSRLTHIRTRTSSSSMYSESVVLNKIKANTEFKIECEGKAVEYSSLPSDSCRGSPISDTEFTNGCNLGENESDTKLMIEADDNVFEVFQDSDVTEEDEMTSSDDDNNELEEQNISKSEQEHFKQLYEKENLTTAVTPTEDAFTNENIDTDTPNDSTEAGKYQFCSFLPSSLDKYNLTELAKLPHDVDWRACVTSSDLTPGMRNKTKQRHSRDFYTRRRAKQLKNRETMVSILDRILSLERHQANTVNRELARRYHNLHHRQSAKPKSNSNGKQPSPPGTATVTSSEPLEPTTTTTPCTVNKQQTVRNTWTQRRSSLPSKNMRLAWATEVGQGDNSVFKQACDSNDLTILHNHWLACTDKRSRRNSEGLRRGSVSSARNFNIEPSLTKRYRGFLYKNYTYETSERVSDDKHCHSLSFTSPRTCAACRERARKMRQSQSYVRRPSTVAGYISQTTSKPDNSSQNRFARNLPSNLGYKTRYLKQTTVLQSVDISSIARKQCFKANSETI